MLGDRAKATCLAALAGGGKVEGAKKVARPSLLTVVGMVKKCGSVVSKVVSGADFAAKHITSPHHASHPMRVMHAFRFSTGLHVEHRRPKASGAPREGLLKVERREFRCLGFRVNGAHGAREALGARSFKYMTMTHPPMFPITFMKYRL